MGKRAGIVVVLLVAVAGVAWLLLGGDFFGSGTPADRPAGAGADGETRTLEADAFDRAAAGEKPVGPREAPVLFGRPGADRAGNGSLAGRVLDIGTGKAVAGAALLLVGTGFGGEQVSARATTTPEGTLHFDPVAAGAGYTLRIEAEKVPLRTLSNLRVDVGRLTDLGTVWLGRAGALEGIVVDAAGDPVAGAVVAAHPPVGSLLEMVNDMVDRIGRLDEEDEPLAKAESGRDGKFRVEGLAPGPCVLLVSAAGHAVKREKVVLTQEGAAGGPVRIVLSSGRVLAGTVVDENGGGVAGARVAAVKDQDPESFFYGRSLAQTGSGGAFRFDTLAGGGQYMLIVAAQGFPTTFARAQEGETDVRVVLRQTVPLTVRLFAHGGDQPIQGAQVAVAVGDEATPAQQPDTFIVGVTDAAGRVVLDARAGVLQMAMVTHPDLATGMWMGKAAGAIVGGGMNFMEGPDDPVVPKEGREVVFRMPPSARIVGRVTGPSDEPIAAARVQTLGFVSGQRPVFTDADGRYSMPGSDSGGQSFAFVRVRAPGYVQKAEGFVALGKPDENGQVVHDIQMDRAGVVTGRVTTKDGLPVSGATIYLRGGKGNPLAMMGLFTDDQTVSLSDGSYLFDGATPDADAKAVAVLPGWVETASETFEVKAGETVRAPPIVMHRGSKVVVRVSTPGGSPARGARVEADMAADEGERFFDMRSLMGTDYDLLADAEGTVRFENLAKGKLTVTATQPGFAGSREVVEVSGEDGAEKTVDLALRRSVDVSGTVTDADGAPIAEARVQVQATPGAEASASWMPPLSATTDSSGAFRIQGVPEGAISVVARAKDHQSRTVAVGGRRDGIAISLAKMDPDKAKRRKAVREEMTTLVQQLMSVKDETERHALTQRMQELSAELQELGTSLEEVMDESEEPVDVVVPGDGEK